MRNAIILTIVLIFVGTASAAPAAPEVIVNNATMECSHFMAGDECMDCEIPPGWVSLGYNTWECPADYREVTANVTCSRFKIDRCCTEGHSGAPGECEGMIINELTRQCRFLNENEAVPAGWRGKPPATPNNAWTCPEGYTWSGENGCLGAFLLSAVLWGAFFWKT